MLTQAGGLRHSFRHLIKGLVFLQAFPHFERQVQARKIRIRIFEQVDHAQALLVVIETAVVHHAFREHLLARMSERRMPEIVREGDCFREILVQPQCSRDCAANGGNLNRMG